MQATNGALYGTTSGGGILGLGTAFKLDMGLDWFVDTLPSYGKVGNTIRILGTNLTGAIAVMFNGTAAAFTMLSSTEIQATVPSGASTGFVTVTLPSIRVRSNQIFRVAPQITAFSPTSAPVGAEVKITGMSLKQTSKVTIGGVGTNFTVDSDTQVTATVPSGAETGPIVVSTPGGATSSEDFTVAPAITNFSPTSGPIGTIVTITGTTLSGATNVMFGGETSVFTIGSSAQITATVPPAATTGRITVITPGGSATSATDFIVLTQNVISSFEHIVVIVQENRTPDNLFQGLCLPPYGSTGACGVGPLQYDVQSYGFDRNGTRIPLLPVPLGNPYDPWHNHEGFEAMCNPNPTTHYPCMRNTDLSTSGCLPYPNNNCSFEYVDPITSPSVYSYLYIAQNFGWANRMFQTNQGSSAPAHQFLFGGTSAPSAAADANAIFIDGSQDLGCLAALNAPYKMIDPAHAPLLYDMVNNPLGTLCFTHKTMATLLKNSRHTWRYYTVGDHWTDRSANIWTAPNAIQEICQPNSTFTLCTGADWINNVDLNPSDVLKDLQNCNLKNMVWVIPTGQNSDHPSPNYTSDGGPAWVANVINGVGSSSCVDLINSRRVPYWEDTAIVVTWDDWGGFYDHVLPPFLSAPEQGQGDYQMGFRVPLLFVSAYTNRIVDSTNRYDFGSILRFAEQNFGITEGSLGFADVRSATDLSVFYDFRQSAKRFHIPTNVPAEFFLNDERPAEAPDND